MWFTKCSVSQPCKGHLGLKASWCHQVVSETKEKEKAWWDLLDTNRAVQVDVAASEAGDGDGDGVQQQALWSDQIRFISYEPPPARVGNVRNGHQICGSSGSTSTAVAAHFVRGSLLPHLHKTFFLFRAVGRPTLAAAVLLPTVMDNQTFWVSCILISASILHAMHLTVSCRIFTVFPICWYTVNRAYLCDKLLLVHVLDFTLFASPPLAWPDLEFPPLSFRWSYPQVEICKLLMYWTVVLVV